MTSSKSRRASLGTILLFLAGQAVAQKPPDLTAVLIRFEGQVTLSSENQAGVRTVSRATPRQVIRRGETVHVPGGSQATLICSTETLVDLKGQVEWVLNAATCKEGLQLPETSYRNSAPQAGRLLPRKGVLLLEFEPRNGDENLRAALLSPRNTAVMEPRPTLIWTRVPDAAEYEIEIRREVRTTIRVAARDLRCGRGAGLWRGLDTCSWVPSERWPVLEPGTSILLRIGHCQTSNAPARQTTEFFDLHILPADRQNIVEEDLRQIAALPLDKPSRLLLKAGTFAREGLYAEAIATYDEALREREVPEARVTLGDLLLAIGLPALADREYRQVLAGAPDPTTRAAAELGLGHAAYRRKLFGDAHAHFESARSAYDALGLSTEAEDARASAALVREATREDGLP